MATPSPPSTAPRKLWIFAITLGFPSEEHVLRVSSGNRSGVCGWISDGEMGHIMGFWRLQCVSYLDITWTFVELAHMCDFVESKLQFVEKIRINAHLRSFCSFAYAILHFGPSMLRLHLYSQSNDTLLDLLTLLLIHLIPVHMMRLNKSSHQNGNVQLQLRLRLNYSFILRSTNVLCCRAAPPPAMPSWRPVRSTTAPS